jgi:hypothetical protein
MRSAQKGSLVELEGFWLDAVETKDADIRNGFINLYSSWECLAFMHSMVISSPEVILEDAKVDVMQIGENVEI